MQSRSYLFLLLVVALAGLSGFLYKQRPYAFGLDVKGGVRFVYKLDMSEIKDLDKNPPVVVQEKVAKVMESRAVGPIGVAEPVVEKKGDDELILELPTITDVDKARTILGSSASLKWYWARNVNTSQITFRPYGYVQGDNPDKPEYYFTDKSGKTIKPSDPEYVQIIKDWKDPIVAGDELVSASYEMQGEKYNPTFEFNAEGAKKMRAWTTTNQFKGENLAAVLDNVVISIAPLEQGAVISDKGRITGNFTAAYVKNLDDLLNSGALPVTLIEESSLVVDPTIGTFALDKIVQTGLIAFALVSLFMLVYYEFPGFIAVVALSLYVLFTLTILKLVGATFSLAGIAGFVLSVGMAVDANILVFERMKEEMRAGRKLMTAIELGFKRALPAIVDSNACTVLTSLVLAQLGTGPVKGFASTLIMGVIISLFTAVFVTRSLLVFFVGAGLSPKEKWYGLNRQWFGESLEAAAEKEPLQIVNKSGRYFLISALTIVPGLIAILAGGIKPNVEFQGGYEVQYRGIQASNSEVTKKLEAAGIKGPNIRSAGDPKDKLMIITVPPSEKVLGKDVNKVQDELAGFVGTTRANQKSFTSVGPTIRDETIKNAVLGVILSSALIIIYLGMRFGFALGGFVIGLRFAVSAVLALIHDILVVIGLAALGGLIFGWEISALFISATLTVIGFSTHDTIVIFDRIRENLRRPHSGEDIGNLINRSITQSIARSINTSMTVIATLTLLVAVGSATPELMLFNAAMLVGIISGTYSSIFNASPILYLWDKALMKKKGVEFGLMATAEQNVTKVRLTQDVLTQPAQPTGAGGQYGTIKRRASAAQKAQKNLDDDV